MLDLPAQRNRALVRLDVDLARLDVRVPQRLGADARHQGLVVHVNVMPVVQHQARRLVPDAARDAAEEARTLLDAPRHVAREDVPHARELVAHQRSPPAARRRIEVEHRQQPDRRADKQRPRR